MDLLPTELFISVIDNLPPIYIYRLRTVSRAWNDILSSESVVRKAVERAGLDTQDLETQEQIMKNHMICRPTSQFTWSFDLPPGAAYRGNPTLRGDLVMCSATFGNGRERLQIVVVDLQKKCERSKTIYIGPYGDEECFFNDKIIVVWTMKHGQMVLKWMNTELDVVHTVDVAPRPIIHRIVACGSIIAGVIQEDKQHTIWTYDTITKKERHLCTFAAEWRHVCETVLTAEKDCFTVWYVSENELNVRRFDLTGTQQFWNKYHLECTGYLRLFSAGDDQYLLHIWQGANAKSLMLDLTTGHFQPSPILHDWVACWRGRWTAQERDVLTTKDGATHRLASDIRYRSELQMNDHWLVRNAMHGIDVLNFQGSSTLDKVIERDGGHKSINWTWERV